MVAPNTIYTIGHSSRTVALFIEMLRSFNISTLADVRSMPGSKWVPQFNSKPLSATLLQSGIKYVHYPALGGRITRRASDANTAKPFSAYNSYMETDIFKNAISILQTLAQNEKVAYMCAEANWWQCHRSRISDFLTLEGWQVVHIMDTGKSALHVIEDDKGPVQGRLF